MASPLPCAVNSCPYRITDWSREKVSAAQLLGDFDAVALTGGAELSRDLPVPGRALRGLHFAGHFGQFPLQVAHFRNTADGFLDGIEVAPGQRRGF